MTITRNQTFEGTLVAVGWDHLDRPNKLSLFTFDEEDILLDQVSNINRFSPYMNKKVRIFGDITSTEKDCRRVAIKKISTLVNGLTMTSNPNRDELGNRIPEGKILDNLYH